MKRDRDALLVFGVAFIVYLSNLGGGFVYDDRFVIELNPLVQGRDWWALVSSSYWGDIVEAGLYRPLTLLSFALNRAVSSDAIGFHLVNNLLHAGVSVLVLRVAVALSASRFVALTAGLIFALHPLQSEAVTAIVGRADLLAAFFSLAALLTYVQEKHPAWSGALFFLALLSKESAMFALSLFALHYVFFGKRNPSPLAVAVLAFFLLRVAVLGSLGIDEREMGFIDNPVASSPLSVRALTAFALFGKYVGLVLWPHTLSADYSFNEIPVPTSVDSRVVIGGIAVTLLIFTAWKLRRLPGFAALAFLLPLVGCVHVLFPLGTVFAERLMYLPMVGAALGLALIVSELGSYRSHLLALTLALLAARTTFRNQDWKDNETLFRRTVETAPGSARSHFLLGAELTKLGRAEEAEASFGRGLEIYPQHVGARMSRGEALKAAGRIEEAASEFQRAYQLSSHEDIRARLVDELLAVGRSRARAGDWEGARGRFEDALRLSPRSTEAMNQVGLVLERQGDFDGARRRYEQALENGPGIRSRSRESCERSHERGRAPSGRSALRVGGLTRAGPLRGLQWTRHRAGSSRTGGRGRSVVPARSFDRPEPGRRAGQSSSFRKNSMMWFWAVAALMLSGQADPVSEAKRLFEAGDGMGALQHLETASRERPDDAEVHHALGALYASAGRMREAMASVERAVTLEPESTLYASAMGELLYRNGRAEEARPYLERASGEPGALILLAGVYESLGERDAVLSALERHLESSPDDESARLLFGQQLEASKRFEDALAVYRRGLDLDPDDAIFLYKVAEALSRSREGYAEAETLTRRALELQPQALGIRDSARSPLGSAKPS